MKKTYCMVALFALALSSGIWSQTVSDPQSMFDNPDMIKEENTEGMPPSMDASFLESSNVDIGGQFSLAGGIDWRKPSTKNLYYSAMMRLTLDARPDKDYRVFAKMDTAYPFVASGTDSIMDFNGAVSVKELFADVSWNQAVYLRAGKQTIAWGVGRYFSPADVLNLTPIDIEDPDAERFGPVALKVNIPFKLNSFYAYIIANDISSASDLAYASKAELLLGETEFALAGFYRQGLAPRGIVMVTFPFGDLDCYTETVAAWGSDKTFLDGLGGTYTDTSHLFFQTTAGFGYKYTDPLENWNVAAAGQFWYNGDGYDDPSLARIPKTSPLRSSGVILDGDLVHPDKYYAVANLGLSDIYKSGVGVSVLWYGALAGATGKVIPSLSMVVSEDLTTSLRVPILYGAMGAEYSPYGNVVTPTLEIKLLGNTTLSVGIPLGPDISWNIPVVATFEFAKALF